MTDQRKFTESTAEEDKTRTRGFLREIRRRFSVAHFAFFGIALTVSWLLPGAASAQAPLHRRRPQVRARSVRPDVIRINSRPAIAFKPFAMLHPETGKPIAPNAILPTLPNGKQPTAKAYYDELNRFEESINHQGYSLRSLPKGSRTGFMEIVTPAARLNKMAGTRPLALPKKPSLIQQLRFLQPTHIQAVAPAGSSPAQRNAVQRINQANLNGLLRDGMVIDTATLRKIATIETSAPSAAPSPQSSQPLGQLSAARGRVANVTPPQSPQGKMATTLRGPINTFGSCSHLQKSQPWAWDEGDPSTFEVTVDGSLSTDGTACHSIFFGDSSNFSMTLDGTAGASLLGNSFDLLDVSGKYSGDSKTSTANMSVNFLGFNLLNLNSSSDHVSKSDKISKELDQHVDIPIQITIFTVNLTIGAKGSAGIQYRIDLYPTYLTASAGPFVHTQAYVQAGLNVIIAEAGVKANLTLLNWDLNLNAELGVAFDPNANSFYLKDRLYADSKLTTLSGDVDLYLKVYYPCFSIPPWCSQEFDDTLFSWSGFVFDSVLFDVSDKIPFSI